MVWFLRSVYESYRDHTEISEFIFATIELQNRNSIFYFDLIYSHNRDSVCKKLYKIVVYKCS